MTAPNRFPCICDPAVLFDPPERTPCAVEGCPAHWVRYIFQQWLLRNPEPEEQAREH